MGAMPAHGSHVLFVPNQPLIHGLGQHQTVPPTQQQELKYVSDLIQSVGVLKEMHANTSMSATAGTAKGSTQPQSALSSPGQLKAVVSPLRLLSFKEELRNHPNSDWVTALLDGIETGVHLGYHGPRSHRISKNLSSAHTHPEVIDKEIQKEVDMNRILGPFDTPPLPNLQCSGVGVVEKKNGGWRMIMHLSAPADISINDGIDKEDFTLRYRTIDDAVKLVHKYGAGALMAKIDIKSAFRTIPVCYEDRELLGIFWREKFYVDRCLPFGLRSAPFIFNQYADALEWILQHNYNITDIIHYLDDFLLVGPPISKQCGQALAKMLKVCSQLGFPIALEKLEGPTAILTFLGILIDTTKMELRLPPDKLESLLQLLQQWQHTNRKISKRQLLSLIGKLSFAAKVVPAGRIFLRRLIDLSAKVKKLHHRVTLTVAARQDIKWWQDFLPGWNGVSLMLQPNWESSHDLQLYTDASGTLGFGAYFRGAWFSGTWSGEQLKHSIQWKEMFAIVAAAATWGPHWQRKKILFHCDNQAVVQVWQAKKPKDKSLASLCRKLFFLAAQNNYTITLKHTPGSSNELADALSRQQVSRFRALAPEADLQATTIPAWLTKL